MHLPVEVAPATLAQEEKEADTFSKDKQITNKEGETTAEGNQEGTNFQQQKQVGLDLNQGACFGPWMLVKRDPRRKENHDRGRIIGNQFVYDQGNYVDRRGIPYSKEIVKGSRYDIISDDVPLNDDPIDEV